MPPWCSVEGAVVRQPWSALILAVGPVITAATPSAPLPPSSSYACRTLATQSLPFCNTALPFAERAADLLARLESWEKISLLGAHGGDICAFEDGGVPRLDIPSYTWCTETNTGVSTACLAEGKCATTFPSPGMLAASFNRSLWRSKATVQSTEQRALFNLGARRRTGALIGLNGWGPNINVVRDPRYGRNSELPSEDPFLNGAYATEVVRGFQDSGNPKWPLKIHSTLKHYTAYSVETNRFGITLNTSLHDLFESFLPQYRAGFVDGGAGGAMCSYASLAVGKNKSTPSCANDFLLNHMVRSVWGSTDALIVSDCEAVASEYEHNHYVATCDEAAAASINAGCDLNTGYPYFQAGCLNHSLVEGQVSKRTLDAALNRSLMWKFRLGLFDDPAEQPLAALGMEAINTSAARQLVVAAASQGLVLLRNDNATLPFGGSMKVAIVGSHANGTRSLLSDYYGDEVCFGPATGDPKTADSCMVTIGASIAAAAARKGGSARIAPGVGVQGPLSSTAEAEAMAAVRWADVVVLTAGIDHSIEHEGIDRSTTLLPPVQVAFALEVLAVGKPTVLVMVNGGALSIDSILDGPMQSNCSDGNLEIGIDYRNTVNQTYTHADTPAECCALCASRTDPPCRFFSYTNGTMHDKAHTNCYLKSTDNNRVKAAGVVSGGCHSTQVPGRSLAAVVEAFYPNQGGAAAIGPTLFGEAGFNRWGKLPITIYPAAYNDQLAIEEAAMRSDSVTGYPGRTYKYFTGKPLFPFGAGMSYTSFNVTCTNQQSASALTISCTVHNTGAVDGDEVLLVFHSPPTATAGSPPNPTRRLIDFERVSVPVAGTAATSFDIAIPDDLLLVGEDGTPRQVDGTHKVSIEGGPTYTVLLE